jgi:hypothetical protein
MAAPDHAFGRAVLAFFFAGLACSGTLLAGPARAGGPPLDACSLLTAADVERVQGGALREAIASGDAAESAGATEAVASTQCFFRVEPFSGSVSLALTRAGRGRADRRELRERWERLLHPEERRGQSPARERDGGREEQEPRAALTPVAGLGEEAWLAGGAGNVSLYVLAPDAFLRLSVGGPGDAADRSRRAQALARAALARLQARPPRPAPATRRGECAPARRPRWAISPSPLEEFPPCAGSPPRPILGA